MVFAHFTYPVGGLSLPLVPWVFFCFILFALFATNVHSSAGSAKCTRSSDQQLGKTVWQLIPSIHGNPESILALYLCGAAFDQWTMEGKSLDITTVVTSGSWILTR